MDKLDKIFQEDESKENLQKMLDASFLDMNKEYSEPDNCLMIKNGSEYQRLFTMGNISTIQGKQKSKKSLLSGMLLAYCSGIEHLGAKFKPSFKDRVCFYFDTEQADYDAFKIGMSVKELGGDLNNVNIICLREFSPKDRLEIVNYAIEKYAENIGYVVIDGISDLVNSINSEEEATLITTKQLEWTKKYGIHITNVVHQKKGENYARGWVGTSLMNKSEVVISVTKDENFRNKSLVKCEDIRGVAPFDDFEIEIDRGHLSTIEIGFKEETPF